MVSSVRLSVPRSNRNDNFIDKSFTVMADLIVKLLPINARAKEAYVYYRDGLSAVSYTHLTLPTISCV